MLIRRTILGQAVQRCLDRVMEAVRGAAFFRSAGLEKLFRDVQGARYHPISEKAVALQRPACAGP